MKSEEKLKFAAHQSFYIREGWLYKGLQEIQKNQAVFQEQYAQDEFGIGANMAVSLRYWLQAVGLTEEVKDANTGRRIQKPTFFGQLVLEYDPHLEADGTLHYLQFLLASNREMASSWYFFFNEFKESEFTKEDIANFIVSKVSSTTKTSRKSIEKDVECLVKTYNKDDGIFSYEDNKTCPFQSLHLIESIQGKRGVYRKTCCTVERFNPFIAYAILLKKKRISNQLSFIDCLEGPKSIGRTFNLDFASFLGLLKEMQKASLIHVDRTAGLDVVTLNDGLVNSDDVLRDYYQTSVKEETEWNSIK